MSNDSSPLGRAFIGIGLLFTLIGLIVPPLLIVGIPTILIGFLIGGRINV